MRLSIFYKVNVFPYPNLCNSKDRPSEAGERTWIGTAIMESTNWMQCEGWTQFPEIQDRG